MKITLTDAALHYLNERNYAVIRIAARDTYECSTMVEYYLQEGEVNEKDNEVTVEGIKVLYDEKALEEMGSEVKVDFIPSQGLKLMNPGGTLAYGQNVRPLEAKD
ncbi:iron-sulfur cluster biosynthesis family protein [Shouchella shacheensis]|uniref:iron-sulfur cluster biosynthesis family protein n=1 Tax=Shouchella shacheensis TaxID=1649580 RepID=UPI0009E9A372|nr:iron-sulfur cluster biosynthesis family protein [Shouchella shacheensis]